MPSRASGSTFYNPEDDSNRVTFRARCEFLKIVLDNEPELAKGVSEDIFPIFAGIDPKYHIETMQLWSLFHPLRAFLLFEDCGEVYEPEEKTLYFTERWELLPPSRIVQYIKLDVPETVKALAAAYDKLKLWRFGLWGLRYL